MSLALFARAAPALLRTRDAPDAAAALATAAKTAVDHGALLRQATKKVGVLRRRDLEALRVQARRDLGLPPPAAGTAGKTGSGASMTVCAAVVLQRMRILCICLVPCLAVRQSAHKALLLHELRAV